ncbi:MAG: PorV/PorQ family protein, partial [Candidatus Margulisiibacteriota bacterium]
ASTFADTPGQSAATFLKIGPGARGPAMADAVTAYVLSDATAAYWNPGLLGVINQQKLSLQQTNWLVDMTYQTVSYLFPTENNGTWSANLYYFNYGGIQGYDSGGSPTSAIYPYDLCAGVSWGDMINDYVSAGLTLKFISQKLDDYSASGFAFDVGALFKTPYEKLTLGATLQNLGSKIKFINDEADLPMTLKFGSAYQLTQDGVITLDLEAPEEQNKIGLNLGFEQWFNNMLAIQLGYKSLTDTGSNVMGGVSLKAADFELDYAFVPYGNLGNTHRVCLSFDFGEPVVGRDIKIKQLQNRGVQLFDQKQYSEAISEFIKVLSINPDNVEAQKYLDKCFEEMQKAKREKAAQEFKVHFGEALRLLSVQDYAAAKIELGKALEISPNDAEAKVLMQKLELIIKIKGGKSSL